MLAKLCFANGSWLSRVESRTLIWNSKEVASLPGIDPRNASEIAISGEKRTPISLQIVIMSRNPLSKGVIIENTSGVGTVTPEMVEERAFELAVIAGRVPRQPSPVDYEQAERELTGGPEMDLLEEALESIPESERWDPVPGSIGRHTLESFGEDEDSEGRSESAQLFEAGVSEAEHDQMLQAARAADRDDELEA